LKGSDLAAVTLEDLRGDPRRLRKEAVVRTLFLAAASLSIVISVLIVLALAGRAWEFVSQVELGSLWSDEWAPRSATYSVKTLLVASLIVTVIAMVIATPLGLGAAIYLSEYANPRLRRILKPVLEVLAGIPSVVLGFFAISFISPNLVQRFWDGAGNTSLMAAGIGVGILTIPLIASVSEDAMRSVPAALREASFGLGAKKITTSVRVVIPAAVSGLVASFILAVSRALGETMVVLLAAGAANSAQFTTNPLDRGLTMTAAIASQIRGTEQARGTGLILESLYFVGFALFVITLVLNIVADRFVRRVRQRY
jgi:phosphate transport system permease protein